MADFLEEEPHLDFNSDSESSRRRRSPGFRSPSRKSSISPSRGRKRETERPGDQSKRSSVSRSISNSYRSESRSSFFGNIVSTQEKRHRRSSRSRDQSPSRSKSLGVKKERLVSKPLKSEAGDVEKARSSRSRHHSRARSPRIKKERHHSKVPKSETARSTSTESETRHHSRAGHKSSSKKLSSYKLDGKKKRRVKVEHKDYLPKKVKSEKKRGDAYYVMRSNSEENIRVSMDKGIWATLVRNEANLNKAFDWYDKVYLVFSICYSGHFQGYAEMKSKISKEKSDLWDRDDPFGAHKRRKFGSKWGGVFRIGWRAVFDLPFQKTNHLRNPLNANKPVKHSRDGQQLPADVGAALCQLMDDGGQQCGYGTVVLRKQVTLDSGIIAKQKFIHNEKIVNVPPPNVKPYATHPMHSQNFRAQFSTQGRGGQRGRPNYINQGYPGPVFPHMSKIHYPYRAPLPPFPPPALPRQERRVTKRSSRTAHKSKRHKRRGRSHSRSRKRRRKKKRRRYSSDESSSESDSDSDERTRRCLALLSQNGSSRHIMRKPQIYASNHGKVY